MENQVANHEMHSPTDTQAGCQYPVIPCNSKNDDNRRQIMIHRWHICPRQYPKFPVISKTNAGFPPGTSPHWYRRGSKISKRKPVASDGSTPNLWVTCHTTKNVNVAMWHVHLTITRYVIWIGKHIYIYMYIRYGGMTMPHCGYLIQLLPMAHIT